MGGTPQVVDGAAFGALRATAPAGPLTYMQLPCIMDGDYTLVQRIACAQYIASKVCGFGRCPCVGMSLL